MSVSDITRQFRENLKRVDEVDRRVSSQIMIGQVEKVDGDKAVVVFDEKDPTTGKPFKSPSLRWGNQTGGQDGLSEYSPLTVGETVAVLSPSGEIGPHSRIVPWGPTDEKAAPGAKPADGKVIKLGNATLVMKGDALELAVGGVKLKITAAGVEMTGGTVKHDGKNIGKDHKHTQVVSGGDTSGPPQ